MLLRRTQCVLSFPLLAALGCQGVSGHSAAPVLRPAAVPAAKLDRAEPEDAPAVVAPVAYIDRQDPTHLPPVPPDLLPPSGDIADAELNRRAPAEVVPEALIGGLTLAEVESLALASNPTLRQASALVAQMRGEWVQAGLYPNPVVGYQSEEINDEGSAGRHGAFVSQTVVTADKLAWRRTVAAREVDQARWRVEVQQARVITDVRVRFYEALGAQQTVDLAEELRMLAQEGVRLSRQLEQALQAPRTDVLQAENELFAAELLLYEAQQRLQAARQQLAATIGIPHLPPAPLQGDLEAQPLLVVCEEAQQQLLAANPALQAIYARVAIARANVQQEQAERIPNLNVQFSSSYDFAGDRTLYGAQVGVPLPIYDRNQGAIAAAVAELRGAMNDAARLELLVQRRFAEVWRRLQVAQNQVQVYRQNILPRTEETLELTLAAYEGAQLDYLRVLTARRAYFENRLRYLDALIDWRQAWAEIDGFLLTGGLEDPAADFEAVEDAVPRVRTPLN